MGSKLDACTPFCNLTLANLNSLSCCSHGCTTLCKREPALDSACEAGPVTTVSERHALQGKTKTDLRRDYANVPCLVSYPRSGNHYLRLDPGQLCCSEPRERSG